MSYDLEVRADEHYSKSVPLAEMASLIEALPGVTRTGRTSFVLDRSSAGIHVNIDIGYESGEEDDSITQPDDVNSAALQVPYSLLAKSGPVALEMAFRIAERLGWSVFDPQADCEVSKESSGRAMKVQQAAGAAASTVLERAAAAEPSFADLFNQEVWNHSLVAVATSFAAVAVASIWVMFTLEWPKERFEKYLVWSVVLGGLAVLWLKGFFQAYSRQRRIRRKDG